MAKDRPPKAPKPPKPPKPLKVPAPEPVATATPSTPSTPSAPSAPASGPVAGRGARITDLLELFERSRLTYGEPVQAGGRTVIPVSRVRLSGGLGWGRGGGPTTDEGDGSGAGGGGHLDAQPVGFIDMGPEGSTFVEIPDPDRLARNVKAIAAAATALVTGLAGARRLTAGRRIPSRRRLGR